MHLPQGPVFAVSTSRLPADVKETLQVERQGPWRAALPTCVSRVHAHGGADRGARQCEAAAKRAQRAISRVVRHACVLARGIDKNKVSLCSLNWRWPVQSQNSLTGFPAGPPGGLGVGRQPWQPAKRPADRHAGLGKGSGTRLPPALSVVRASGSNGNAQSTQFMILSTPAVPGALPDIQAQHYLLRSGLRRSGALSVEFPSHSTGPPGGSGKSGHLQLELCRGKRAQLTTTGHGTSHRQWTRGRPAYLSAVAHEISTICLRASRCAALCLSLVARSTHHLRSNTPQTTHLPVGEPGVHVSRRRDSLQTSASASRLASPFYRRGPPPTATGLDNNRIAELSNPASLRSGRVRRRFLDISNGSKPSTRAAEASSPQQSPSMFFLYNMERRVTLHPSYFGRNMHELVTSKLLKDVEGTCAGSYYIISIMDTFDISEGRILPGNGLAEFTVGYRAVVWRPFKGETVDAVVYSINPQGFFAQAGPLRLFVSAHLIPSDIKWDPNATPPQFTNNEDTVIEPGTHVRVKIIGTRTEVGEMWAIGSIKEDYLGYDAALVCPGERLDANGDSADAFRTEADVVEAEDPGRHIMLPIPGSATGMRGELTSSYIGSWRWSFHALAAEHRLEQAEHRPAQRMRERRVLVGFWKEDQQQLYLQRKRQRHSGMDQSSPDSDGLPASRFQGEGSLRARGRGADTALMYYEHMPPTENRRRTASNMRRATAQPPRPLRFQPPIACSAVTPAVFVGAPLQIHPRVEVTALTAASLELIPALLGPALRGTGDWLSDKARILASLHTSVGGPLVSNRNRSRNESSGASFPPLPPPPPPSPPSERPRPGRTLADPAARRCSPRSSVTYSRPPISPSRRSKAKEDERLDEPSGTFFLSPRLTYRIKGSPPHNPLCGFVPLAIMNALRQTRATTTKLLSSASPASNGTRALLVANASVAQSSAVPRLNISGSNSRHFGTTRRAMAMQASNRLKTAFAQGRQSMGMWQMLPGANVSRLLARSGVDWVMVDCEHGNMDDSAMHDAVPAIAALGVSPLVRIPDIQSWMVKRALDSGAHGVLVPLLRSVEQAKELVQAAKFPPMGRRGFGSPIAPERFSPMPSFTEYLQQANDALLTMVQIETREALDVVEDIAAVDGIDVLFIGPFDLGNSIGHPILNGAMAPELTDAIGRILAACRKAGKKCGMYATSGEQAKTFADQGFDMISVAADYTALEYVLKQQFGASQGQGATSKTGSY
ncbi:hypothetical protein Purlil1_9039 [Purpureocillium lilacinum]|uniref:HpcH/HpaI aldolase/citrate lyase domain-containing protein n=1 Tax=Purpureocillium lilacinum TaxID=33203 RepID=A0ABR0BRG9_PURLI|nr:hypothetical protein Purlil1_9039 [Purpureocillium lilacinum]